MDINLSSTDPVSLVTSNINTIVIIFLTLLSSGTLINTWVENRIKKLNSTEEKLREDRRKIYFDLLKPFVLLFNRETTEEMAKSYLTSDDYRRTSFEVTLIGSDAVVKAYGNLMQYTFKQANENYKTNEVNKPNKMIVLLADLLLEIRKDLEHNNTKLTKKDMLRHMITDIDDFEF